MSRKIITLAGTFNNVQEMKQYCEVQFAALRGAQEKIKQLEEKLMHLEELLAQSTNNRLVTNIPTEQLILETQVEKLQKKAFERELTLEETKRLDLLVKNLLLVRGHSAPIETESTPVGDVSEAQLLQIASTPDPKASHEH